MRSSAAPDLQLSSDVDLLQSRARKIADQSKEVGIRTMVELDEQNEKLKIIEQETDELREEVRQAEENIREMEKCCGIFAIPWRGKFFKKEDAAWNKSKEERNIINNQPKAVSDDTKYAVYVDRITNEPGEDEMEGNLSHVHQTASSLRHMAAGINAQVRSQNRHIDGLIDKVNSNEIHVKEADRRANKLRPQ